MSLDQYFFWAMVSMTLNVYLFIVLARRWPQLRMKAYVFNLIGFSLCAYALAFTNPDPTWLSIFLLNFTFQNALLHR